MINYLDLAAHANDFDINQREVNLHRISNCKPLKINQHLILQRDMAMDSVRDLIASEQSKRQQIMDAPPTNSVWIAIKNFIPFIHRHSTENIRVQRALANQKVRDK